MWPWTMRIFGGINILAAMFGIYYFALMIDIHWGRWPGNPSHFDWAVFVALSLLSTFLVVYLAYLGVRLIRQDAAALRGVCLIAVLEIAYFFADTFVTWNLMPFSASKISGEISVAFWGIAEDPLAPQIVTGYPLIALVAAAILIIMQRRFANASQNFSR